MRMSDLRGHLSWLKRSIRSHGQETPSWTLTFLPGLLGNSVHFVWMELTALVQTVWDTWVN